MSTYGVDGCQVSWPVLDDLEMILGGANGPASLSLDGTWAVLPMPNPPFGGGRVVLTDPEGVPFAALDVSEVADAADGFRVGGVLEQLRPLEHGPARRLRQPARDVMVWEADTVLASAQPWDVEAAVAAADGAQRVLLLGLIGHGRVSRGAAAVLMDGLEALAVQLSRPGVEARAVAVPLTAADSEPDDADLARVMQVCAAYAPAADVVLGPLRASTTTRGGVAVLLTGLSGSGKSTVARELAERTAVGGRPVTLLDGDVVRTILSDGLGFTRSDRERNLRRIGFVCGEVVRHGGVAIACPIAPYATSREEMRRQVVDAGGRFVLVHVATPLEVCEARDRKGLYAKARRGEIEHFTGISDPYELPVDADLVVDTSTEDLESILAKVQRLLQP